MRLTRVKCAIFIVIHSLDVRLQPIGLVCVRMCVSSDLNMHLYETLQNKKDEHSNLVMQGSIWCNLRKRLDITEKMLTGT